MDSEGLINKIERLSLEYNSELKKLHDEIFPSKAEDKILYKYTSLSNLGRIIGEQHLTFTHIEDLNDPSEVHYAMQTFEGWIYKIKNQPPIGGNLLESYRASMWKNFLEMLECCLSPEKFQKEKARGVFNNIKEIKTTIYTNSFSSKQDNLPMWRWYGDNGAGVSIGFRSSYFGFGKDNIVPEPQAYTPSVYTPVMYETEKFRDFVSRAMNLFEEKMSNFIDLCQESSLSCDEKVKSTESLEKRLGVDLASFIMPLLPAIKHHAYKEEDECRLYYLEFMVRTEDDVEICGTGKLDDKRKVATPKPRQDEDKRLITNSKGYVRRYKSEPLDWNNIAEIWIGPRPHSSVKCNAINFK